MPLTTVAELIAAGAQWTLEQIAARADFDESLAADYLSRRFGNQLQPQPGAINELANIVQDALASGQAVMDVRTQRVTEAPVSPQLPAGYNYTVIGELSDPLRPPGEGRTVTYPMTFNSATPLSYDELQGLADQITNQAMQQGALRFEGAMHGAVTLPGAAAEIVRESTGEEALPTIQVLAVYRGA